MREIKFRGKKENGEWVYGSLCLNPYDENDVEIIDHSEFFLPREPVIPDTVGQFTGLVDANGVEIYEGDIIGGQKCKHLVLYTERSARFEAAIDLDRNNRCGLYQSWIDEFNKVVVGNIYEGECQPPTNKFVGLSRALAPDDKSPG